MEERELDAYIAAGFNIAMIGDRTYRHCSNATGTHAKHADATTP